MSKGYFLFQFSHLVHAQKVLSKGHWTIRNSLLILQPYDAYVTMQNEGATNVHVWVEFPGLPISMWYFLKSIAESLKKFVCYELE